MLILDKLWDGALNPSGRRQGASYSKTIGEVARAEQALLDILSPEGKKILEAYDDRWVALCAIQERDAFFTGFRIAGQLLLDILGEPG